jgi:N-methylhydantoinase B
MPARIIEKNESPLNPIDVDGITVDLIENALKNAPQKDSDYFKAPTVLKK